MRIERAANEQWHAPTRAKQLRDTDRFVCVRMRMAWLGAQMACGDKKACPKGGRPEYRNGPQYELVNGKQQGDRMTEKNEKACGHGVYAESGT